MFRTLAPFLLVLLALQATADTLIGTVVRVADGDTLTIEELVAGGTRRCGERVGGGHGGISLLSGGAR